MKESNPDGKIVMILAMIVLAAFLMSDPGYEDQQIEQQHYCEMVGLWNSADHLPKEDRPGWPPYNGECHD